MMRGRWARVLGAVSAAGVLALAVGCGSEAEQGSSRPAIVVTTPVMASLVSQLAGGSADVEALLPNGADPHDYSPSAREVALLENADLVVENGLALEEGLLDALDQARDAGVPVFTATDHVDLRTAGGREGDHGHDEEGEHGHADEEHHGPAGEGEHGHDDEGDDPHAGEGAHGHAEGDDPHIWMDPLAMRAVARALSAELDDTLGIDPGERAARLRADLAALDERVRERLAGIPAERRRLVSGHESMGYFADRYDLEVVGVLLPSLSSQAEASAGNLADLRERIDEEGISVIFNETGTPPGVADAIARETGARVVEIATHTLPDDGSYETFIVGVADTVAGAYDAG